MGNPRDCGPSLFQTFLIPQPMASSSRSSGLLMRDGNKPQKNKPNARAIHPPDGPSFVHKFHGDDTPSKWRAGSEADLLLEERNHGRLGGDRVWTFEVVDRP